MTKTFPERLCMHCGATCTPFKDETPKKHARRKFCSRQCYGHFHAGKLKRPIDAPVKSDNYGRKRAALNIPMGPCARCGAAPVPYQSHVHHRDENPRNNSRDNLERICSACHGKEHSAPKPICSRPGCDRVAQLKSGECFKHRCQTRYHTDPSFKKRIHAATRAWERKKREARPPKICAHCGENRVPPKSSKFCSETCMAAFHVKKRRGG